MFLARSLSRAEAEREHEEQDLLTRLFAPAEVERMVRDGELNDATKVASLGLLRLRSLL